MEKYRVKPNTLPTHSPPLLGAHSGSKRWRSITSNPCNAANREIARDPLHELFPFMLSAALTASQVSRSLISVSLDQCARLLCSR